MNIPFNKPFLTGKETDYIAKQWLRVKYQATVFLRKSVIMNSTSQGNNEKARPINFSEVANNLTQNEQEGLVLW
jgi:hypothetical protein